MLSYKEGKIVEISYRDKDITKLKVELDDRLSSAISYNHMVGTLEKGDRVLLNTTAVELGLGTGGVDFVINNLDKESKSFSQDGHIMKLRYTPLQIKCMAVEAEESPYHDVFLNFDNLDGHICIVGSLHSMLAPIVTTLKYINPELKINYIMTDGGCLPIAFSNTVRDLKKDGLIDKTITIGHAFGGDLEAINIYNALIASKEILESDITIVTMGPGIVGSGTKYGFSGMEQGEIINAVYSLGGRPILVPRIGFSDKRERHRGLSHHTRTVLETVVNSPVDLVLAKFYGEKRDLIENQIREIKTRANINYQHEDGLSLLDALKKYKYDTRTMGRNIDQEREYFLTLGAVAEYSNKLFLEEDI